MGKKSWSISSFILWLASSIILYSFLVDFIFRKYEHLSIISVLVGFQEKIYWVVVALIIFSVIILFITGKKLTNIKYFFKKLNKKSLILILILLAISSVRLWDLDMMPLNFDEGHLSFYTAKTMYDYGFFQESIFIKYYANMPINGDINKVGQVSFGSLIFLNFHVFKNPIFALRTLSVFFGILTVVLTFLLIKELYGWRTGFLSALFLALLPWHVIQSRVGLGEVLIPLFGLLIFYTFNKALNKKDIKFLYLTSVFLGIGGLYIYLPSRIFLVITALLAIIYYKKLIRHYNIQHIIVAALIFLLFLYPYLALMHIFDYQPHSHIEKYVQQSEGSYAHNLKSELKMLFVDKETYFLFGQRLNGPLLSISLAIISSFAFSYYFIFRKIDLILLMWVIVPLLCVPLVGVQARYIISILPFFLIFIAKFLNDISKLSYVRLKKKTLFVKKIIPPCMMVLICFIILNLVFSLIIYFQSAPKDLEENREWSYGVKQAIDFLFEEKITDEKWIIFEDWSIESYPHVWYHYFLKGQDYPTGYIGKQIVPAFLWLNNSDERLLNKCNISRLQIEEIKDIERKLLNAGFIFYYLIWNPATHNETYREGGFSKSFKSFKQIHPDINPIQIIYYPSGEPALNIYEIKQ